MNVDGKGGRIMALGGGRGGCRKKSEVISEEDEIVRGNRFHFWKLTFNRNWNLRDDFLYLHLLCA